MRNVGKGHIYALISALCFGIMPIFTVKAYSSGISVYTLLFLRFSLSSVIFFIFFLLKRIAFKVNKEDLKLLLLLGGVLFTLLSVLHFESLKFLSSSMAILILFSFPIFVSIFSFLIYKEKLNLGSVVSLVFSFMSMTLLLGISLKTISLRGFVLALLAAVIYALYMMVGKKATCNNSSMVTSAYVTLFAAFGVCIIGLIKGDIHFQFNSNAWIHILCIVFISTILGELALFKSLEILSSTNVSMISMIEPVFTAIFAFILLNESLALPQIIGGLLIVIGITMLVYFQSKSEQSIRIKSFEKERGSQL